MIKKLMRVVGFLFLTIFIFHIVDSVLCVKSIHGIDQARGLYDQPENTVDVLFLGSSHVHCNVDTRILWEEQGIAAYICSTAEQPLWNSYHYLVEALKNQQPELVVLDMFSPVRFYDDVQEDWLAENLDGMRVSWNKYEMVKASVPSDHILWLLAFPRHHNRYSELAEGDFFNFFWNKDERADWKGYVELDAHTLVTKPDLENITKRAPMTSKSQEYFDKIVSLLEAEGIPLLLINAPYIVQETDQYILNEISVQAQENELLFLNASQEQFFNDMGLVFDTDFADESHLNIYGAEKFSRYLGNWIKENYDVPDRRGQEGYESWENQTVAREGR